ncbi:hypothetical protein Tco_0966012 [Tanacetum coccineum]
MGNLTGVSVSLGGGISSGGKKYWESNIGGSDNTRHGGTTVGGGIILTNIAAEANLGVRRVTTAKVNGLSGYSVYVLFEVLNGKTHVSIVGNVYYYCLGSNRGLLCPLKLSTATIGIKESLYCLKILILLVPSDIG